MLSPRSVLSFIFESVSHNHNNLINYLKLKITFFFQRKMWCGIFNDDITLSFLRLMRSWRHYWRMEKACMMRNRWCLSADSWSEWKPWSRNSSASSSYKYDRSRGWLVYNVDIFCYHLQYITSYDCVSQDTQNPSCLKQFLDHHGLSLLWILMMELSEAKGNSANNTKLQFEVTHVIDCAFKTFIT